MNVFHQNGTFIHFNNVQLDIPIQFFFNKVTKIRTFRSINAIIFGPIHIRQSRQHIKLFYFQTFNGRDRFNDLTGNQTVFEVQTCVLDFFFFFTLNF